MSKAPTRSGSKRLSTGEASTFYEAGGLFPVDPAAAAGSRSPVASQEAGHGSGKVGGAKSSSGDDKVGHRARLRDRLRQGGDTALPDYELLEMLLFRVYPRGDTKPLAKRLIAKFGTFAEVVSAPPQRLLEVEGVGQRTVDELAFVRVATQRLLRGQVINKATLSSWSGVLDYLRSAQAFENREQFRILFLDKKNTLIADEVQGHGTVDHTPVYIREVVKRSLELSATAIVLVHNHPSGDPTPSRADIEMTKMIVDAARPLGISVHDHIIVGRNGHASLKGMKLM